MFTNMVMLVMPNQSEHHIRHLQQLQVAHSIAKRQCLMPACRANC
jgi:hypothetical protein